MHTTAPASAPHGTTLPPRAVVVMGISGCGKTTLGERLAQHLQWTFVEGDAFHSEHNQAKMHAGIPLTDEDRASWLIALGHELARHAGNGVVLSCSALKLAYRQLLRTHVPGLQFIWLEVDHSTAYQRVAQRGDQHFFPTTLVDNQLATLEPPHDEAGSLHLSSGSPVDVLLAQSTEWLQKTPPETC